MNNKTVFIKTSKGEAEAGGRTSLLFGDIKRVFILVDDKSTVDDLRRVAAPSLRATFDDMLEQLVKDGYIQDRDSQGQDKGPAIKMSTPKMATPKMATPPRPAAPQPAFEMEEDLDFTSAMGGGGQGPAATQSRAEEEAEARRIAEAEIKARAEAAAKARAEMEAKARAEAEVRARLESEAKVKAAMEAKMRADAEARARAEAEARIRAEAEARARAEAEARARAEAEAKARAEAEARARAEAEARAHAEAEARARAEAEARARAEAEARARAKAEEEARERARAEEEARAKARAEEEARERSRREAENLARIEAEAKARAEAEIQARMEAETRIRAEIEAKERAEEERRARIERETKERVETEMRLKAEAEEKIRREQELAKDNPAAALASSLESLKFTLPDFGKKPEDTGGFKIDLSGLNPALDKAAANVRPTSAEEVERIRREQEAAEQKRREAQAAEAARIKAQQEREAAERAAAERALAQRRAEEEQRRVAEEKRRAEEELRRSAAAAAAEAAQQRAQNEAAAYRAKVEEEAAKSKADEAQRMLAQIQAKAWEDAERRAEAQAKAEAEQAVQQEEAPAKRKEKKPPKARKPSKPLPWGMIGLAVLLLAVGAVVGLPYVYPWSGDIPKVEEKLSAQFKQPVHIGGMSAASVPSPRLELKNVTIGANQELKAGHVVVYFDAFSLAASTRQINELALDNIEIDAAVFSRAVPWLQFVAADPHYPVNHVSLHGVHLSGDAPALPALAGDLELDTKGQLAKAALASDDGKFAVTLQPQQGHLQVDLNIKDGHLPTMPDVLFARLDLTGAIGDDAISISTIDGRVYGGHLTGSANLSWQSGWQAQGGFKMEGMDLNAALPKLKVSGELSGDTSFSFRADKLTQLAASRHLEGTFELKDGAFNNIDVAETVRGGRKQVAGGVTHFDSLSGTLVVDATGQHVKQVKVIGGAMTMAGAAEAGTDGKLSGQLVVDMNKVRAGMGTLPLKLTGTTDAPGWVIGR